MADSAKSDERQGVPGKVVRSQKIVTTASPPIDNTEDSDASTDQAPLPRSHTPGQLASKAKVYEHRRRNPSEVSNRQWSSQAAALPPRPATAGNPAAKPNSWGNGTSTSEDPDDKAERVSSGGKRQEASRSASGVSSHQSTSSLSHRTQSQLARFPLIQGPDDAPDVAPAPASGMYWSKALVSGGPIPCLRAHTTALIGSNIYVIGGCDARACFNDVYVLDADSFYWSRPHVVGDIPTPLRAMTCTAVGKKLVVFGGGDGPAYYNDVYVLDTVNFRWTKPRIAGEKKPSKRRAHTACFYKNGIYVFGGGDGVRALNDIWRLDVSDMTKMSWSLVSGTDKKGSVEPKPKARGYHTANMVGSKLIIFGGSDGGECFDDVWVYDVEAHFWKVVTIPLNYRRLSHTATIVGSYLFVIGGHDGSEYSNDVLLLNLVTMTWDKRKTYGKPPCGRGYHGAILYDSRLVVIGGFDGSEVFKDVMILELAVHAYYSQISHFTIEV
ncbi:unnamed protein product [Clonostachys chloroleuca]|uniref:Uncharacterized protein n=1 Tax=Clonostachys chloroleuca TaxID=1926264 RepID=A0AA35PVI5_9HYPO|nr:unnamed protein product [Clonostachys chloroleuca]